MHFPYVIFFTQFINCLLTIQAYKTNVTCISAQEKIQGQETAYIMLEGIRIITTKVKGISHETYKPDNTTLLFNCTEGYDCVPVKFSSITELTAPNLILKSCFTKNHTICETIRFNNLSKIDKLSLLSKTLPDKYFYFVYCSLNLNSTQICHENDAYTKLVYKSNQVLRTVFDEFICEEDKATIHPHDYRDTLSRRKLDMNKNLCDDDDPPPNVDCTRDVCISWQHQLVDCDKTDEISPPDDPKVKRFIKYTPKSKSTRRRAPPQRVLFKIIGINVLKKPKRVVHNFKYSGSHNIKTEICTESKKCKHPVAFKIGDPYENATNIVTNAYDQGKDDEKGKSDTTGDGKGDNTSSSTLPTSLPNEA